MKFTEIGLENSLLEGLSYMGFEETTPIQTKAIPEIIAGRDLIACAQTGTGKTAAFVLPILNHIARNKSEKSQALIIAPTRELAMQIDQQIQALAYFVDASSLPVYGGGDAGDYVTQQRAFESGVDIIVATPGKLISHLNMGYLDCSGLKFLVLDEADRMLDMGFFEDIMKIISFLPKERQNLFFSATMPPDMRKLAKSVLIDPFEISLSISKPAAGVLQAAYMIHEHQKPNLIRHLISEKPSYASIIIFCSTKRKVIDVVQALKKEPYDVEAISSDLEQRDRELALQRFKARQTRVLVGTDVISRGIDVKDINLVINYDVPNDAEDYVHRVGRTARADSTGVALTLINERESRQFFNIESLIEMDIIKLSPPPDFGPQPLYEPHKKISRSNSGYNNRRSSNSRNSSSDRRGGNKGRGNKRS